MSVSGMSAGNFRLLFTSYPQSYPQTTWDVKIPIEPMRHLERQQIQLNIMIEIDLLKKKIPNDTSRYLLTLADIVKMVDDTGIEPVAPAV